ncbi:MAG TPA: hypothetical protein VKM72_31750 [Thermoanaerobaculia bacterium]|nr:hypothetical protein [Thermoanaerobaculia bacterium]
MPAKPHELPYPTLSPDTDPDAERVQIEIFRRMPAWRKVQLVEDAIEVSRQLALAGLRQRHPNAGPEELHRRFLSLSLGEELAARVYGPLPESITDSRQR